MKLGDLLIRDESVGLPSHLGVLFPTFFAGLEADLRLAGLPFGLDHVTSLFLGATLSRAPS